MESSTTKAKAKDSRSRRRTHSVITTGTGLLFLVLGHLTPLCSSEPLALAENGIGSGLALSGHQVPSPETGSDAGGEGDCSKCAANITRQIFTRLPTLIEAIGQDERTRWSFRGPKGEAGSDGPEGVQGIPGPPGQRGEMGVDGLPGPVGPQGDVGPPGDLGPPGPKGQKGEPAPMLYARRIYNGEVVEIKGEKGESGYAGHAGPKGERGYPGLAVSIKGAKGEPCLLPNLDEIRGHPGPRGPPGPPGFCRRCKLKKKMIEVDGRMIESDVEGPVYIPHPGPPGPPGISVVGEPGPPGPPGAPGTVHVPEKQEIVTFPTERHMQAYDQSPPGTLIYTTEEDKLFIRTRRGWNEIELGRFVAPARQSSASHSPWHIYTDNPATATDRDRDRANPRELNQRARETYYHRNPRPSPRQ